MSIIFERAEEYFPQIIESLDREGRTIVRASRHKAAGEEWVVTINTSPRSLPDMHLVGKGDNTTLVRNLVELLAQAIEDRGWGPTYSLGGTWTAGTVTNGRSNSPT